MGKKKLLCDLTIVDRKFVDKLKVKHIVSFKAITNRYLVGTISKPSISDKFWQTNGTHWRKVTDGTSIGNFN